MTEKYRLVDLASDHWRHQPRDRRGRWSETGAEARSAAKALVASAKPKAPAANVAPSKASRLDSLVSTYAHSVEEAAKRAEKKITSDLTGLVSRKGGTMYGLKYRLKEHGSLSRKIKADAVDEFGGDVKKAAENIKDAVRYTVLFKEEDIAAQGTSLLADLAKKGHKPTKIKNFFNPPPMGPMGYKGVNIQMVDGNGHPWELQVHTQKSIDVKMEAGHKIYEAWRVIPDKESAEAKALWAEGEKAYAGIPVPPGIATFS